jgi:hypothetical protein
VNSKEAASAQILEDDPLVPTNEALQTENGFETQTHAQRDRELKLMSRTTTHDFLRARLFLLCKAEMQILVSEASSSAL